jgi:hypothetical protein
MGTAFQADIQNTDRQNVYKMTENVENMTENVNKMTCALLYPASQLPPPVFR